VNAEPLRWPKPESYVALAAALGSFLTSLDASAVNAVLPLIREAFHTSIAMMQWVLLAELLVTSGLLLAFGRLGDLRGHKPIYRSGFWIFLFGSALCAAAPGMLSLIAFRIIQGVGSAMLLASSPALLVKHLPAERRGQALGLRASLIYLGLATGPAMGGWLAGQYGWRAVFCMQLPFGMVGLALTRRIIPRDSLVTGSQHFDLSGAALWTCGLAAVLFGLNRGNAWGWTSLFVLLPLLFSAPLLIVFLMAERRTPNAMVDLTLLDRGSFSLPVATLVLSFVSGYLLTALLPFYLMQGRRLGPATAGLLLGGYGLIRVAAAPLSGRLSDWIGPRLPATFGAALLALGAMILSQLNPQSSLNGVMAGVLMAGAGIGMFVPPNNSMLMGAVPPSRQGIAAGILATARTVGMGIGIALAGVILSRALENDQHPGRTGFAVASAIALSTALLSAVAPDRAPVGAVIHGTAGS
jgi:EmrB/QacA subfamily drug resistance transporter